MTRTRVDADRPTLSKRIHQVCWRLDVGATAAPALRGMLGLRCVILLHRPKLSPFWQ